MIEDIRGKSVVIEGSQMSIGEGDLELIHLAESYGFKAPANLEDAKDLSYAADSALDFLNEHFHSKGMVFYWESCDLFVAPLPNDEDDYEELLEAFKAQDEEITQILAEALGFPKYTDLFDEAKPEDGCCVAGLTPVALAKAAAKRIKTLEEHIDLFVS